VPLGTSTTRGACLAEYQASGENEGTPLARDEGSRMLDGLAGAGSKDIPMQREKTGTKSEEPNPSFEEPNGNDELYIVIEQEAPSQRKEIFNRIGIGGLLARVST